MGKVMIDWRKAILLVTVVISVVAFICSKFNVVYDGEGLVFSVVREVK